MDSYNQPCGLEGGNCQRGTLNGNCDRYATVKVYFSDKETDSIRFCPTHLKQFAEDHYNMEAD